MELNDADQSNDTAKKKKSKKSPKSKRSELLPPLAPGKPVHIGIDSEWVFNPEMSRNEVLSYQYCLKFGDKTLSGIFYTGGPQLGQRLSLVNFLSKIIRDAIDTGNISEWPGHIYLYAHFFRADFATFSDCWDIKKVVAGVRGTISDFQNEYGIDFDAVGGRKVTEFELALPDRKHKKSRYAIIHFVDTMLITPNKAALSAIGELIDLPKVSLPAGYSIAEMDRLLEEKPDDFEAYAIRDAEIAVHYGLLFQCFCHANLNLNKVPLTIGAAAVSMLRKSLKHAGLDFNTTFGYEIVESKRWNRKRDKPHSQKKQVPLPARKDFEANTTEAYFGARNETFYSGPTVAGVYHDYDLAGAYTTAMLGLHPLNYGAAFHTRDVDQFLGHVCGFARIRFRFPDDTRFPSLPVQTENYGLYYPREGVSVCTAAEIELAVKLGCEMDIEWGVVIPWQTTEVRIFADFVQMVNDNRSLYAKGSLPEKLWKEIGNSLYGKLGQGLKEKTGFDTVTGLSKKLSPSAITHPYFAAYTTGFVRAVISELIASIPTHRRVISVTTDGFLTDANLTEINQTGPLSARFQAYCELLEPGKSMLVQKHKIKQGVPFKTRGFITALNFDDEPGFLAKAGIKPPCPPDQHNAWMLNLYLSREPGQKIESSHLISLREQWLKESDLIDLKREQLLNMEFDFKRRPVDGRMVNVAGVEHLSFDSVPWQNREEGEFARMTFDGWRQRNCLKTLLDWGNWEDHYLTMLALDRRRKHLGEKRKPINVTSEGSLGILKRVFIAAYLKSAWGIVRNKKPKAELLADLQFTVGLPIVEHDDTNCHKWKLIENSVPKTPRTEPVLKNLASLFTGLEDHRFFIPDDW
ncbi:MAG: DNA polymerase [Methylomonas sp.]|nr:DNA polymerase [Methylomonas sp.]